MALTKLQGQLIDATTSATTTDLAYTGTLTGGTGIVNIGSGQIYKKADGSIGIGTTEPNLYSYNFAGDYRGNFYSLVATNQGATNTNAYLNLVSLASGASSIIFGNETTERGSLYVNSNSTLALSTRDSGTGFLTDRLTINNSGAATLTGSLSVNGNTTLGDASGDTLTINAGTTTFAQGTANGVLYLNGSKVATSGSGLVFDGTALTVPSYLLVASSQTQLGDNGVIGGGSADGNTTLRYFGGKYLAFKEGSTEQMRLTSTGLGIGTISPSGKVHSIAGTDGWGFVSSSTTGAVNNSGIYFAASNGNLILRDSTGNYSKIENSSSNLVFGTNSGTERMRIDSSGNVGIGTNSPGAKLDVVGAITATKNQSSLNLNASSGQSGFATITNSGGVTYIGVEGTGGGASFSGASANASIVGSGNTNPLQFVTNGAVKATLDSSGNVGIGTSSPVGKVHSKGNNNQFHAEDAATGNHFFVQNASGAVRLNAYTAANGAYPIIFSQYITDVMTIDTSGNLGLGVTPSAWTNGWKAFQLFGGALSWSGTGPYTATQVSDNAFFTGSGSNLTTSTYIYGATPATLYKQYNGTHSWHTAPSGTASAAIDFNQVMTLDASGNLLVGTTSVGNQNADCFSFSKSSGYIAVNHVNGKGSGSGYVTFGYNGGEIGSITQNGTTAVLYNTSSDQRLKTNITPAASAIQSILDFPVDQFDWISSGEHQDFGGIAQKIIPIIPEMVSVPEDQKEMMGVDWSKAVPRLIRAYQELHAEIELLKSRI